MNRGETTKLRGANEGFPKLIIAVLKITFLTTVILTSVSAAVTFTAAAVAFTAVSAEADTSSATAHKHSYVTRKIAPRCMRDGKITVICKSCGHIKKQTTVPKLGHTYKITKRTPTEAKAGFQRKYCTKCGFARYYSLFPATGDIFADQQTYDLRIDVVPHLHTPARGDAVLLSSGGKYLLMDTYEPSGGDSLLEYLESIHVNSLDLYISHYHYDHMGNAAKLIRSSIRVNRLYLPDDEHLMKYEDDPTAAGYIRMYQDILAAAAERNVPITYLRAGKSFKFGRATVKILYGPSYDPGTGFSSQYGNGNSLVARVTAGGMSYMTCGDLIKPAERELLARGILLHADVVKLSHHGESDANLPEFVGAMSPSYAFFCHYLDTSTAKHTFTNSINAIRGITNVLSGTYNRHVTFTFAKKKLYVYAEANRVFRPVKTVQAVAGDRTQKSVNVNYYTLASKAQSGVFGSQVLCRKVKVK